MKTLCLLAVLLPGLVWCQVANLIVNPGFEEGEVAPASWDLGMEGRGAGSAIWETEAPHSGARCARAELTEAGDYWMARQNFAAGSAQGDHAYRLSGWYKGTEGAARPCVYFRGADGAFLGAWETGLAGTEKWRPFDFVFKARPGTDRFELQLRVAGGPGVAWWDDVVLEDAEELVKQGKTMVAPLLKIAEEHPEYVWAIVANGGKAQFELVGGEPVTVAWAVANAEGATEDYGVTGQNRAYVMITFAWPSDGPISKIAEKPTNGELQTVTLPRAPTHITAFSENRGPGPIMLVGLKLDDAVQRSLAGVRTSPARQPGSFEVPWESRILPASVQKIAAARAENRNDILRKALGAGGSDPVAQTWSAWRNYTEDMWVPWVPDTRPREGERLSIGGARGEYLSAQILYAPPGRPKQVTCKVGDFVGADGARIPASECQVRLVEYVELEGTWYPDPLMEGEAFTPSAHGPIVFWLTVHVPEDAKAGRYTATATMNADGGAEVTRRVGIHVWPITLPAQTTLHTSFWLSRGQINRWFDLPGDVAMEDYYPWIDLATSHRLSPIDFVEGPTVPMVKVYREADGTLSYDFAQWDLYLDRMKLGKANTIHLGFTHWMAHYFTTTGPDIIDRQTGEVTKLSNPFGSKEHLDALATYLKAAEAHVRAKGFDFTYIQAWDEPNGDGLANSYAIMKGLKERAPEIPRLMTAVGPGTFDGKMDEVVNLWVPLSPGAEGGGYDAVRERGDITWWYVCCGPGKPYANLFTHWRAAEMRVLFWQTWQYKMSGLLYWSMNYWWGFGSPLQPKEERFPRGPWKSETGMGDGYFMYPSEEVNKPLSSIRLETIRDGIEDYDLLHLLNSLVEKNPNADPETLAKARALLAVPPAVSKDLVTFDRNGSAMDAAREDVAGLVAKLQ